MPKYVKSKLPERLRPADYDETEHGSLEYIVIGEGENEVVYQKDAPCTYYLALKLDLDEVTIEEEFSHVPRWVHEDAISEDLGSILYSPIITCEEEIAQGSDRADYSIISDKMHEAFEKDAWTGEFNRKIPFGMVPSRRITFKLAVGAPPYMHSVYISKARLAFEVALESIQLEKLKALVSSGDVEKIYLATSIRLWKKIDENTKSMSELMFESSKSKYVFFSDLSCDHKKEAQIWNISLKSKGGTINPSWKTAENLSDIALRLNRIHPTLSRYLTIIVVLGAVSLVFLK